ncbi:lipopolysaccharide biosynthesis protein [Marinobacter sp. HL-58]|uniref:lipopolysaccharide biosynthesis protein n=1 Tax=Marinobacter sp. HL-58 TaxID=1479237 RepID=UPI00055B41DD|nr:oligosaccharide flippase family protein [Marinobacter sp. HL-58]
MRSQSNTSSIFKNMAVLASGTGIAKLVGLLSIPIITRIYTPEHMGVLAVFTALVALIVPIGTLRYSVALPLPRNDRLAVNLAVLCIALLVGMSFFSALILWLLADPVLQMLNMQALLPYWWLLIIAIVGAGFYEILTQWATREKAFKPLAKTKVWQSTIGAIVKISLGLAGLKPLGLLIGQVVTQAGGILSLSLGFYQNFWANLPHVSRDRMIFLFKRYADFPKFRLPSQFLLVFSSQTPLLFSAWLFGAETTGQLGLALMALALPIALFGQTTGQAYYAEIAKVGKKNPEKIYKITRNVTKKLLFLSLPPFLILLIFGPILFEITFGAQWRQAGVFASILAIYLLAQFVSSPLVNILSVFGRQWIFLRINIVRSIGILFVFCLARFWDFSPVITLGIYAFALSVHYFFTAVTVINIVRRECVIKCNI